MLEGVIHEEREKLECRNRRKEERFDWVGIEDLEAGYEDGEEAWGVSVREFVVRCGMIDGKAALLARRPKDLS